MISKDVEYQNAIESKFGVEIRSCWGVLRILGVLCIYYMSWRKDTGQ